MSGKLSGSSAFSQNILEACAIHIWRWMARALPEKIECAARVIGAEQMLLGSDYPLSNDPPGVLKLAVDNVRGSTLSEAQKHTICCGNAQRLFGLNRLRTFSRAATS